MDLTFVSPKSQPHCTLISCAQLSATLSSAKLDFLGFSQNLRPPAAPPHLRARRTNSRKFYSRGNYSQPFLLTASLDANSVVLIVAVTTISALSIAYWYHFVTHSKGKIHKTKESSVEDSDSDSSGFALAELGRNILNRIFGDSRLMQENHVSFEEPALVPEESRLDERQESSDSDFVDLDACIQVVSEESVATAASALPIVVAADISELALDKRSEAYELHQKSPSDLVALDDHNHVVSEESGTSGVSALPDMVAAEISELDLDKRKEGNELDSETLRTMMEVKSSAVSSPVESDLGAASSFLYHSVKHEPVREGLYSFYGEQQSTMKSSTKFKDFKASSRLKSDCFPSLKVNPVLKRAELSEWYLQKSEEYVAKNMLLGHYEGGSSVKTKRMEETKGFTREKRREYTILNNHIKLPELLQPNGTPSGGKVHLPKHLNTYNSLLRAGRLTECVDLLEDMERKGLLDMNKVYHAKFFNLCKIQSAVKEAFHFCKLIPNPTLSTFNMLMSVCAYARDSEGGFQVLKLSQTAGFNPDCKLYTTLISTCAKSGKVDSMFEVFHQMVNAGVQPNIHTYGALIDGCARAGQVAKAFGAYGIMRSKNVKPDRVIFNALITACGQSGAVDRAFDVLAEMRGELQPIDPDHITVGALMTACAKAGQVGRAQEVYNMIDEYNIKGTPEVYTIAISCCSQAGDWEFASKVYDDMTRKGVIPDEMFLSSMIDVAGHAGKVDAAFEVLQKARIQGQQPGIMTYSSLMGACSNGKNWQRALELYEDMKSIRLKPTVPTMNALITALCDGDQLPKATEVLTEMKGFGLCPNTITYSILFVASERKDDLDIGLMLLDQARRDNIHPNVVMYKCLLGMCLRRYQKACSLGEPVLSFESGGPQIENKWTSLALKIYRETMAAAEKPPVEVVSQVLGCLQFPCDASLKDKLIEDLGVTADSPRHSNLFSLVDGFGQYDPRAFSLFEEASSLGIIPCITFKQNTVVVDAKRLQSRIAEVYVLTVFKGLKHRLAAGAKLPNVNILLPVEEAQTMTSEGEKTIHVASRVSQGITSLLRRIGLPYQGNESYGKIRINGISLRRWLQPKLTFPFTGKPGEFSSSQARLGQGITLQQRDIRTGDFALY